MNKNANGVLTPRFAGLGQDKGMWGALAEKMFAKIMGNYNAIVKGANQEGLIPLTGLNCVTINTPNYQNNPQSLWSVIAAHDTTGDFMVASSKTTTNGIVNGHAYTILGVKTLKYKDGQEAKLV
jgi:hypothetical protein